MTIYIYDIEVFKSDWMVVFRNPEAEDNHIVIHNNNFQLREFLAQPDIVIGGWNNKRYDDWILITMINGGDNDRVKAHNDFIIDNGNGWEYPFIRGQARPFKSFDLRDDIADKGLSLKAVEGNLYLPIVESSIPFDLDRPLTEYELDEVIQYCKSDVDATIRLYRERVEYLTSKKIVGNMYGVPESEAIGLTNAKLSARVLGAKAVDRSDERDYEIPKNLNPDLIPDQVFNFFMQIRDKSIPDVKLFGTGKQGSRGMSLDIIIRTAAGECPVTYAWGGVHGAKTAFKAEATEDRLIVNYDVASLYPNSMINFGYCSRSMEDPKAFEKIVETRLAAKRAGDKERAGALKLVVNSTYGAMLNKYNALADRRAGRAVCISNQLAMSQLIVMLAQHCGTIDFININTDGIMFMIDTTEDTLASQIVEEWSRATRFEMERDDFAKIIQKDVNNYIGILTSGKMKTKGGYVSLYNGGDFKTNSLVIVHKAIVDYLVKDIPVETTINKATNIFDFQMIAKTGGTYDHAVHYIGGEPVRIQNVNRIYASKNPRFGQIKKVKYVSEKKIRGEVVTYDPPLVQEDTLSECPEHAIIDNKNELTISDIDKTFYIDMAKKRIKDYMALKRGRKKETEVIEIMPTKNTETADWSDKNIFQKLLEARRRFLAADVKKTGINRYAEFKYFQLEDIVPPTTSIFNDLGLLLLFTTTKDNAVGYLYNTDKPDEHIAFQSPMVDLVTTEGKYPNGMNAIQALGGAETYQRRYIYMMVLDIVEADTFDATSGKEEAPTKKNNRPASPEKREEIKKELIDEDGEATDVQIKSIKNGLKKLRDKDETNEPYVKKIVKKIKAGLSKAEAENLLIEIGEKVKEG